MNPYIGPQQIAVNLGVMAKKRYSTLLWSTESLVSYPGHLFLLGAYLCAGDTLTIFEVYKEGMTKCLNIVDSIINNCVVSKREMNNEWNVNFVQNISFGI